MLIQHIFDFYGRFLRYSYVDIDKKRMNSLDPSSKDNIQWKQAILRKAPPQKES